MISFLLCLAILIVGYFVYGKIVDNTFGPDDRETPAVRINDGVDYVVMPQWKLFLVQLLNIAGLGPIFGAMQGALWGPVVFLWITFGTIFAGGVHDYFSGMMSERNDGASIAEITGKYLGPVMQNVMRVFSVVLLIMVGTRAADRAMVDPGEIQRRMATIHIDVDPAEIGKIMGPTIPIVGDIRHIMNDFSKQTFENDFSDWLQLLNMWKKEMAPKRRPNPEYVDPAEFIRILSEKLDDDAIYVADVGQNQIWSAGYHIVKNGRFLTSGGMGTMGYSIPAGIGAKMCTPDKQVVVVCGDGSFQMSMYELGTIAVNKVPIKILVMRNHYLGLVREHQEKTYKEHYFGVHLYDYPKYAEIAAAYDMDYFHCDSNETLDAELDRFLACDKACIMVCEVDSHNNTK